VAGAILLGGVTALGAPMAGAATVARAACDYYHPDDCLPGGGDDGGGTVETPVFDPSLIGLAATAAGGGTAGLLLRRRTRSRE